MRSGVSGPWSSAAEAAVATARAAAVVWKRNSARSEAAALRSAGLDPEQKQFAAAMFSKSNPVLKQRSHPEYSGLKSLSSSIAPRNVIAGFRFPVCIATLPAQPSDRSACIVDCGGQDRRPLLPTSSQSCLNRGLPPRHNFRSPTPSVHHSSRFASTTSSEMLTGFVQSAVAFSDSRSGRLCSTRDR